MKPTRITLDVWPNGRVDVISNVSEGTLPKVVKLDKSDPDFEQKKADLKAKGYQWNRQNSDWRLPADPAVSSKSSNFEGWWGDATEVVLSKADKDLEAKKDAIKAAGAIWDGPDQVWVLPQ